MEFLPAVCPSCAGQLQVPNDKKIVKCMYCGIDIVVPEATKSSSGVSKENLRNLANTAFSAGNSEESYNYFNRILEIDPNDAQAWFGKAKSAGWMSTLVNFRVPEMVAGFENAIKFADEDNRKNMVRASGLEINEISRFLYTASRNHLAKFVEVGDSWSQYLVQCSEILSALDRAHALEPQNPVVITNIIFVCKDNIEGIKYFDQYDGSARIKHLDQQYEQSMRTKLDFYVRKMQALDSSYRSPIVVKQKKGCFIATATMGSPDTPEVLTLRRFRDNRLNKYELGHTFIENYYRFSPYLAEFIKSNQLLRKISFYLIVAPAVYLVEKFEGDKN